MGAFNGNTLVALGGGTQPSKIGIEQDNALPDSGALTWGRFDSPADLAGTTGVDCKLVHGDRWQELEGYLFENIASSIFTMVSGRAGDPLASPPLGSWTISLAGNMDTTIHRDLNQEVYGESSYLFVDKTDTTHVTPVNFDYQSPMNAYQPTQHLQSISYTGLATALQMTAAALILQGFGIQLSVGAIYNLSAALVNHQAGLVCPTSAVVDDEAHLTKAEVEVMRNKIGSLDNIVDVMICNLVALDLHAGAVLGPNQVW